MLTHEQVAKLSPQDRTQLAARLAAAVFPSQAKTCAALDIALRTWQIWQRDNSAPIMAVLALQSITAAPNQPSALLQNARQIAGHLEKSGREMAAAADLMASVVKRLPDPSA